MTEIEDDPASPALTPPVPEHRRPWSTSRGRWLLGGATALGVAAVVGAQILAEAIAAILPMSARVRGLGTNFESFEALGPALVRRTGIVVLSAVAVVVTAGIVGDRRSSARTSVRFRYGVQAVIAVSVGAWYGWLARPHNAYPSNARFHWVDYLTFDSDNYFYAAGRLPHVVFYDVPWLWQAINVSILVLVIAVISNRLRLTTPASALMCLSPALATNLLLFADTAEDVVLNVTLLLGVLASLLTRRPVVVGLALAFAMLGRPTFVLLAGCLVGAEVFATARRSMTDVESEPIGGWLRARIERAKASDWRFLTVAVLVFVLTTAAFQLLFGALGRRYLFTNGRVVDTGWLDDMEPIDVDGFFISPLSGAYLLHLLWVMPLVLLVGWLVAIAIAPRTDLATSVVVHFCALAVPGILLAHELKPLSAYSIRYLTYVWPFLFVSAWAAFAVGAVSVSKPWRAGLLALLVLGGAVLPVDPVDRRQRVVDREETELLEVRREVDDLVGAGDVVITFGGRSTRNLLAYVIKDSYGKIRSIYEHDDIPPNVWVVTRRSDPLLDREPQLETDRLLVYAPE